MKKILIVEDDMASLFLIKIIIDSLEETVQVLEASNGSEGLTILERNLDIDIMLLDICLPIMNGEEVLKSIRSKNEYSNLVIIAITTDTSKRGNLFKMGIDDFIEKPIRREEFIKTISVHLSNIN